MAQEEKAKEPTVTFQAKGGFPSDPKPMEVKAAVGDIKPWDADSWAQFEQMGKPRPRGEAPLKATGRAKYTYDVKLPGMLYGRMIGAEVAAGEILSIDTSKAEALPGVKAVWTADSRVVRFAGQDVAAVAAVSPEVAHEMAVGALERFGGDIAVSITGIAGPDGGSDEKPVGFVCFEAIVADGGSEARSLVIPGGRSDIRDRSALVGMHLLRRLLS